jgi:hypothetical protein
VARGTPGPRGATIPCSSAHAHQFGQHEWRKEERKWSDSRSPPFFVFLSSRSTYRVTYPGTHGVVPALTAKNQAKKKKQEMGVHPHPLDPAASRTYPEPSPCVRRLLDARTSTAPTPVSLASPRVSARALTVLCPNSSDVDSPNCHPSALASALPEHQPQNGDPKPKTPSGGSMAVGRLGAGACVCVLCLVTCPPPLSSYAYLGYNSMLSVGCLWTFSCVQRYHHHQTLRSLPHHPPTPSHSTTTAQTRSQSVFFVEGGRVHDS